MDQTNKVDWLLLPLELWDYVFRFWVVDEYHALRLAQTCTTLWEVYKSNGVKEWAWRNRWIKEAEAWGTCGYWKGAERCSDLKKEGVWRSFYHARQLWREEHWVDGKLHGVTRAWHNNGQLACERHWQNGKEHGLRREWKDNEQLWFECPFVYGKRHGLSREWYENGQLHWEDHWVDGKGHGFSAWDQNGVITYEKNWVYGVEQDGPKE